MKQTRIELTRVLKKTTSVVTVNLDGHKEDVELLAERLAELNGTDWLPDEVVEEE